MAISGGLIFFAFVAVIVLVAIIKTAVVVPQKTAYIVERLGKYRTTLEAGFHIQSGQSGRYVQTAIGCKAVQHSLGTVSGVGLTTGGMVKHNGVSFKCDKEKDWEKEMLLICRYCIFYSYMIYCNE